MLVAPPVFFPGSPELPYVVDQPNTLFNNPKLRFCAIFTQFIGVAYQMVKNTFWLRIPKIIRNFALLFVNGHSLYHFYTYCSHRYKKPNSSKKLKIQLNTFIGIIFVFVNSLT
jgi:hypothetical protein